MPKTKGRKTAGIHSAANGIYTESVHFKRYMVQLGFMWVPTMTVGSGCLVHLREVELPKGRTINPGSKAPPCCQIIDGGPDTILTIVHVVELVVSMVIGNWRNRNG